MSTPQSPGPSDAGVSWAEIDGELLVYDGREHTLHLLNRSAALVFLLSGSGATDPEIVARVAEVSGGTPSAARRQVDVALRDLADARLIDPTP